MTDYSFNDDAKQARYEAFQANEALTSLAREMSLLRVILESAIQKDQNRLALDCIKQLSNCAVATEAMLVRAKQFLPVQDVLGLIQGFGQIVLDVLQEEGLPQETIDNIVSGVLVRISERRRAVLLLEDQHDRTATTTATTRPV